LAGITVEGSKSFTSPAICDANASGSKSVILSIPHSPAHIALKALSWYDKFCRA